MKLSKVLDKPYVFYVIIIFLIYIIFNILFSGFYKTIKLLIIYSETANWMKYSIAIVLSLTIGALVAINAVYGYIKYKERKSCLEGSTLAGIGALGGIAAGVCPLCVSGLFPIILSFFGVSFSFGALPFNGIEIQVFIIILLIISLFILTKDEKRNYRKD